MLDGARPAPTLLLLRRGGVGGIKVPLSCLQRAAAAPLPDPQRLHGRPLRAAPGPRARLLQHGAAAPAGNVCLEPSDSCCGVGMRGTGPRWPLAHEFFSGFLLQQQSLDRAVQGQRKRPVSALPAGACSSTVASQPGEKGSGGGSSRIWPRLASNALRGPSPWGAGTAWCRAVLPPSFLPQRRRRLAGAGLAARSPAAGISPRPSAP